MSKATDFYRFSDLGLNPSGEGIPLRQLQRALEYRNSDRDYSAMHEDPCGDGPDYHLIARDGPSGPILAIICTDEEASRKAAANKIFGF